MRHKYEVPDPALDGIGTFNDVDLQHDCDEFVAAEGKSYVDALVAGATIEEIDMVDIQEAIDITVNMDIKNVYQNLLAGSENHLRAYVDTLNSFRPETK
jgi:hypothetical protein